MVLALPAFLAQHFELNWKLLILFLSVTAKKKKEKNLLPKVAKFHLPTPSARLLLSVCVKLLAERCFNCTSCT